MENQNIEKRYNSIELRANKESRTIEGYAILFNSESEILGNFIEVIERSAINENIINQSDIKLLYNHSEASGVLARSKYGKGTLSISIDERGVKFSTELPNTSLGNDILELVKRGDLDACSFAFTIEKDSWTKLKENMYKRTISQIKELFDFSIVVTPAYSLTSVSTRSLDELNKLKNQELLEIDEEQEKQERQAKAEQQSADDEKFKLYMKKLQQKYL